MAKNAPAKRNQMRKQIAYLAARLMAEDGVQDYVTAKTKAARQAGVPDTHCLPDKAEIDEALRAYRVLYQEDEHPETLAVESTLAGRGYQRVRIMTLSSARRA